jgi:hypothetical protein
VEYPNIFTVLKIFPTGLKDADFSMRTDVGVVQNIDDSTHQFSPHTGPDTSSSGLSFDETSAVIEENS